MKNRVIAVLLLICILFCGCDPVKEDSSFSDGDNLIVPENNTVSDVLPQMAEEEIVYRFYYDNSDGFHPYRAKTQTQYALFPLLYDGLIKISPEYDTEYRIAKYIRVSGNTCRITLQQVNFSNGDPILPEDVLYSLEMAMTPGGLYAASLQNVESFTEEDGVIVITLKTPNRFFAYNLDFPILQKSSADDEIPVGRGRYLLQKNGNTYRMEQNPQYGLEKDLPDIELTLLKSNESMLYAVKTDAITAYADHTGEGGTATIGTWTASMSLNHLVFLGINPESAILSDDVVRKALLHAVNRNAVLTQAYGSQGVITATPVNPRLTDEMQYDFSMQDLYNPEVAKFLLEEAGFTAGTSSVRVNERGEALAVSLLVNKNNSIRYSAAYLIAGMLEAVGFRVTIERLDYEEYQERIVAGTFDLYLGETNQSMDASMDVFINGAASFGLGEGSKLTFAGAAMSFLKTSSGETKFFDAIFNEVPMVPLLYRNGLMIYSKSVENKVITAPHDMFYNIEDWN